MSDFVVRMFRVRKEDNLEFWVSHLIVLLATVFGVYLAAVEGFNRALDFEQVTVSRENYYLRVAMRDELADNLDAVEAWGARFAGGGAQSFAAEAAHIGLDTFVWDTMREAPSTFEIPGEILTGIRRYYGATADNLRRMTAVDRNSRDAVDAMLADSARVRAEILPLIDADLEALGRYLDRYGMLRE